MPLAPFPPPVSGRSAILRCMQVRLRLYADLARALGNGARVKPCDVPEGSTVEELLEQLRVAERPGLIVGLNGKLANRAARLAPGDEIELMTAMEGGVLPSTPPNLEEG